MRAITKESEPPSLTAHRQTPHGDYDNYPDKDTLRRSLSTEQRGLCCYCMGRIRPNSDSMKIEHWRGQARYPDEQLRYRNMLGACLGDEGQPHRLQHCDTRKGDQDLRWNPADPDRDVASRLSYRIDGAIVSDDCEFDRQLNDVLNLNLPTLKQRRKGVLDAVLEWWRRERNSLQGPVSRRRMEHERDRYRTGADELAPYCQVAVWWLERRIARLSS